MSVALVPPRLVALLASFDEAALGALASVGLVRRAGKDLELERAGESRSGGPSSM